MPRKLSRKFSGRRKRRSRESSDEDQDLQVPAASEQIAISSDTSPSPPSHRSDSSSPIMMATSPANSAARTPSSVRNDYQEFESSEEGEAVPSALEPATKMAEKSSDPQSSDCDASAASLAKKPAELSAENLPSMGLQPAKRSVTRWYTEDARTPRMTRRSTL
jgi:hypothetical protein